ncbi:MAG TPA: ABC transporter ATP-binding protein [Acidimicrobiia bacterium]|nr:ABC transporter ATP-binding protein [Acidimicrobiia bacterium]
MTATLTQALAVADLRIDYRVAGDWLNAIRGVTFAVEKGESFGLVGESGCGKSTIAMAVMRYLPRNGRISGGSIELAGRNLRSLDEDQLRQLRLKDVSMVYQNPGSALNPSLRIDRQLGEVFQLLGATPAEARDRTAEALRRVQISDPSRVMRRYPHQLSGGMQQRVVIAMALASSPDLLILDEPTTGLDATVEAEVLDLIAQLRMETGTSVLFISHNLAVIRKMCDRVGVLYAGRLVEEGPAEEVFDNPRHPYTVGLLRCLPQRGASKSQGALDTIPGFLPPIGSVMAGCVFADRCGLAEEICHREEPGLLEVSATRVSRCHFHPRAHELPRAEPAAPLAPASAHSVNLVDIDRVSKTFVQDGHPVFAVVEVSLRIAEGETLALVGESGSGKSTLARLVLGLTVPDKGSVIELEGDQLAPHIDRRPEEQVRAVQIVFQNPDSALNRRHTIRRIIGRAMTRLLHVPPQERDPRMKELLASVRVGPQYLTVRPQNLSGGLKQRVAIARAFAGDPKLVVCDEPTSALDVSVQAAILNLLARLQADSGVAYLFISHDLGVVRYLADRVAVLYLGRLMEVGTAEQVFSGPNHPYTEALLSASTQIEGDGRIRLHGEIPSAATPPSGCVFHTRCPRFLGEICVTEEPPLAELEPGHSFRCHIPLNELRRLQSQ